MTDKIIIFDPAERSRKDISKICLKLDKQILIPENLKGLEMALCEGHKPLITEFNLACLKREEINSFLGYLIAYQTPAIINTNSQLYKDYLDQLKNTKVYSIIRKIPFRSEATLRNHIEFLLSNQDYEDIKIIDPERATKSFRINVIEKNNIVGNNPYYNFSDKRSKFRTF